MEKVFRPFNGNFQVQEISDDGAKFAESAGLRQMGDPIRANSEKVIATTERALNISYRKRTAGFRAAWWALDRNQHAPAA
jgi:hypothetical protein